MEILTNASSPTLISNKQVLEILKKNAEQRLEQEGKRRKDKKKNRFRHRDWIETQVINYLDGTPCVQLEGMAAMEALHEKLVSSKQTRQTTDETNETAEAKTTGFGLTDAEALQLVNFMPTEPVEIHLMIEELHARMSETKQEELIDVIKGYRVDCEGSPDMAMVDESSDTTPPAIKTEL